MIGRAAALAAAALLAAPAPAFAQSADEAEAEAAGPQVSANAAIVSDYRFRGVSLSDRDPALQGGLDLEWGDFYAGAWATSIAEYEGAEVELDLYAGVMGGSESFGWSLGGIAYVYPGGEGVNYLELTGTAETYLGPVTLGLEAAWAPEQDNIDVANTSLGVSVAYETPLGPTLFAKGGYEDGFYDGKLDWEFGASYAVGPVTASLSYVDSNYGAEDELGRLARAGVVASLLAEF